MSSFINIFTIVSFVFGVPIIAVYFKQYRKHILIFLFFWILFLIGYYKNDDAQQKVYLYKINTMYKSHYTKEEREEIGKKFYKMWSLKTPDEQDQMIKNLEQKEIKGFRQ